VTSLARRACYIVGMPRGARRAVRDAPARPRGATRPSRHALALAVVATDTTFSKMIVRGEVTWVGRCIHCNSRIAITEDGRGATLEHIVPRCHGGDDDVENLALACARCNHLKGTRTDVRGEKDPARLQLEEGLRAKRRARWRPPVDEG